jgi:hypothetical protein
MHDLGEPRDGDGKLAAVTCSRSISPDSVTSFSLKHR